MQRGHTGATIRRLRLERDEPLTQEQLAAVLGVKQNTVSDWETGDAFPSVSMLPRLAKALNTTVDELLEAPAGSAA